MKLDMIVDMQCSKSSCQYVASLLAEKQDEEK